MSPALVYARAALARGPLVLERKVIESRVINHYRFGRRRFSAYTVKRLADAGEAVRKGKFVERGWE